ncbi:MAG: methyltransferase domain-containing protein [archaeon]|nr:methyltransferase domain-containing protein [archaeon]
MENYNITQLHPEIAFEKHVFHRDMFAHYLRWSFVLHISEIGNKVLDFGCGSGNLAEVLYRNKFKASRYLGLDIRKQTINKACDKFKDVKWIEFQEADLCGNLEEVKNLKDEWSIISSFEVAEHVSRTRAPKFLDNIKNLASKNTIILISTPVFDEKVGAAANHTYDGNDGFGVRRQEFTYDEFKELLEERFIIEEVFGTFSSQKDYKYKMNEHQKWMFEQLKKYYDSNLISIIFAPMFPLQSRNCLWKCRIKNE